MADLGNFDANKVEPAGDFEPIPAGKYLAVITGSQMKPTRKGSGSYLELTFQVIDGDYKGRQLWSRHNLDNPNTQTVQIARGELSAICRATGVMAPRDSVELHNLPLVLHVRCKNRDDNGELANEVKGFSKKEAVASKPQPQQAVASTPPWRRG